MPPFVKRILSEKILSRLQLIDHYFKGEVELRFLRYLCDHERVSLDIGANIGTYTYFIRRYSQRVHAYEPNPDLAARLGRLYPDVVVHPVAVSDSVNQARLRIPLRNGNLLHELASVSQTFSEDTKIVEYVVPTVRIDDEDHGDVGFIKIDVEQHELAVIKGGMETIRKYKPVIMTEVTPLLYPKPLPEIFENITSIGYTGWFRFSTKYHRLQSFAPEIHANEALWGSNFMGNNIIFLPPGKNNQFLPQI